MNTANIFKKISQLVSLTDEEYASKIGDFYTSLTTDKRFIFLEDSAEWDLRNRHTAEIVVTDDDDDEDEEIEDEEENEEEIEDENLEDDLDSVDTSEDDLDDDDDIGDLSIITDEELEEN